MLQDIVTIIIGISGWFAFLLQLHNRPILKFKSLKYEKDYESQSLLIKARVANKGWRIAIKCSVDYLIYDCETKKVLNRETINRDVAHWENNNQIQEIVDIPSHGRHAFLCDIPIETEPIVTDDPCSPYLWPTGFTSQHFIIFLIISYGDCRRIVAGLKITIMKKVDYSVDPKQALEQLQIKVKKFRYQQWNLKPIIKEHDKYLEELIDKARTQL